MNVLYIKINVDSANLKGVINTLCKLNFRGFNVTIPHKTNILQYLDSLDPLAQEVNAVNTILHDNKKLTPQINVFFQKKIEGSNLLLRFSIVQKGQSLYIL